MYHSFVQEHCTEANKVHLGYERERVPRAHRPEISYSLEDAARGSLYYIHV